MTSIQTVSLVSPVAPAFQVPATVKVDRDSQVNMQQNNTALEAAKVAKIEPPAESKQSSSNQGFSQFSQSQRTYADHQPPKKMATVDVDSLMSSIAAQRAAAKLMERAGELEQLAQQLRAQSRSSQNDESVKDATVNTALQAAQSAHSSTSSVPS